MTSDPEKPAATAATVTTLAATTDDYLAEPSAGEVLHRVLARSARTFLLNDAGIVPGVERDIPVDDEASAAGSIATLGGAPRRSTEMERVHQSRVACRRIRSNLRTFRLLVDPVWSMSLRAELAWYAECLGEPRDFHILRENIVLNGPLIVDKEDLQPIVEVIDRSIGEAESHVDHARESDRYARLVGQMLLLWDGPLLARKAERPADELLPKLLERSWHDVRGAGLTARKKPTDDNLHKLRIRIKGLRYGCETAAVVEGGPARKTAKAAERLQSRLGDLHDAGVAIEWLQSLGDTRPELAEATERLTVVERAAAAVARKGWKDELKEVERRWRRWQG
ncbi:MAG: CHAD domain-containing protein [Acidimicrobiales bacterium]|jgi:CHAD domain-containing protein